MRIARVDQIQFFSSRIPVERSELKNMEPTELFLHALKASLGVKEQGGNNKGQYVEMVQRAVGPSVGEPWCMSLQQAALAFVEATLGIKSRVAAGEHCLTVLAQSGSVSFPQRGDLVIWQHGATTNGHVGAITSVWGSKILTTIEGNTSDGIGIDRDGDGVYMRLRPMGAVGSMKIAGFIRPF